MNKQEIYKGALLLQQNYEKKIGVLLVNVGTPSSPSVKDVKKYLKEFLWDKRILSMPIFFRFLLLYFVILPFRTKKSAHAYTQIWTQKGSPLLVNSYKLAEKLGLLLNNSDSTVFYARRAYIVEVAMRYQYPSISEKINLLIKKQCEKIIVFPMYPQYAGATTASTIEKVNKVIRKYWNVPNVVFIPPFYNNEKFLACVTNSLLQGLNNFHSNNPTKKIDFILFSYHGLPENQIIKSDCSKNTDHCLTHPNCCDKINAENYYCYRAQCFATTSMVMARIHNKKVQGSEERIFESSSSFQSRLGRTPWIKPYTDEILVKLAQQSVRNLAIICPSFTTDCLETLEEIGIRTKKRWLELGGKEFLLIPCLNDNDDWVQAISEIVLEKGV